MKMRRARYKPVQVRIQQQGDVAYGTTPAHGLAIRIIIPKSVGEKAPEKVLAKVRKTLDREGKKKRVEILFVPRTLPHPVLKLLRSELLKEDGPIDNLGLSSGSPRRRYEGSWVRAGTDPIKRFAPLPVSFLAPQTPEQ